MIVTQRTAPVEKGSFPDLKQASIAVYSRSTHSYPPSPWPHPVSRPRPLMSLQSLHTWIVLIER